MSVAVSSLLLALVVACDNKSSGVMTAPRDPRWNASEDSIPALCAAWECRSLTQQEYDDLNVDLYIAYNSYLLDGRVECAELARNSIGTLAMNKIYVGTVARYPNPQTSPPTQIVGETGLANGSLYIHLEKLRQLGSINDVVNTVMHEQFHVGDVKLHPVQRGYDYETPAYLAADACTI